MPGRQLGDRRVQPLTPPLVEPSPTPARAAASATALPSPPPAWTVLEQALRQHRPVQARYHGHQRIVCPHALGFKNGRAKVLAYQTGGTTSTGALPADPRQRWRSLFIDELEQPIITHGPWQTADNYRDHSNGIDHIVIAIDTPATHDLPR